jgi:hypothetical protein
VKKTAVGFLLVYRFTSLIDAWFERPDDWWWLVIYRAISGEPTKLWKFVAVACILSLSLLILPWAVPLVIIYSCTTNSTVAEAIAVAITKSVDRRYWDRLFGHKQQVWATAISN